LKFPRKLKITKEGGRFILLCLGVGIAAINTGLNLLFLILAMMLSNIMISGMLSDSSLRRLKISRIVPSSCFAGQEISVRLIISNLKKILPSFSLRIKDSLDGKGGLYVLKIPPGQTQGVSYPVTFPKRGLYEINKITLGTKFPFSFFEKSMEKDIPTRVLVYPKIKKIDAQRFAFAKILSRDSSTSEFAKGGYESFYGLREYRLGDNPKWIHWKSSARFSRMMVKEFEALKEKKICLLLDTCIEDFKETGENSLLEAAVVAAASLANYFIKKGYQISFSAYTPQFNLIPYGNANET
jgi:uncharacterized protein (DUF58 family)